MERYNEYKDSGIEWLGEIPASWEVLKAKLLCSKIGDGLHGTPVYDDNGLFKFINGNNLNNGVIDLTNARNISEEEFLKIRKPLTKNTVLYSINGTIGNIAFYKNEKIALGKSVAYLNFKKESNKHYYSYLLQSKPVYDFFNLEQTGTTINNLSLNTLNNTFYLVPPLKEQTVIANYLDTKTTAIDKKIKLLKQKIKHYKAYRKTLINETVTKGLDKTVKLKDSGIDWLGEIPEHWDIVRIKDKFFTIAGGTPSTKVKSFWIGEIPWIPSGAVQNGEVNASVIKSYISVDALKKSSTKMAKKDSILIALTGATCSNIGYLNFDTTINQSIVSIDSNKKDVYHRYYFYFLISAKQKIRTLMTGGAQGGINQGDVKYFKVCFFSKKEQKQIADFLDAKTNTIDNIVNNIEAQISTLKELRKTLINEVVTGKVKVTA